MPPAPALLLSLIAIASTGPASGAVLGGAPVALPPDRVSTQIAAPEPESTPDAPPRATLHDVLRAAESLEPPHRLGVRASALQAAQRVVPVVVLVSDERSYLEAVARWNGPVRYPVLWDDGSPEATADIERFVRAFNPEKVLRWQHASAADADERMWPDDRRAREALIVSSVTRGAGVRVDSAGNAQLIAHADAAGIRPAGVVVTWHDDPAWTAAVALAAARLQPVLFVTAPGQLSGAMPADAVDSFAQGIEARIAALPVTWQELGDDIDAVTLCLNTPARARAAGDDRDFRALTDRIGRHGPAAAGARWAWAGQVHGSHARAAYRAMSSLFLPMLMPDAARSDARDEGSPTPRVFLFDAYESGGGWDAFDAAAASQLFAKADVSTTLFDAPRQGVSQWRAAASRPLDASLLLVNSMGSSTDFELRPGTASAGDVPVLARPALVHFVHSFSAQFAGAPGNIAHRFLEHGAVAYTGSVHEPFLDAFVPTPVFAGRMLTGWAYGAAARTDHRGWWRIAVFGDPLLTFFGEPPRLSSAALPLTGTEDLDDTRRAAFEARDYATALRTLRLLGRTPDAARLAGALLESEPSAVNAAVAREAVPALFFDSRHGPVLRAFERLGAEDRARPVLVDAMWHAARAIVLGGQTGTGTETGDGPSPADAAALMAANVRQGLEHADAIEAAEALARHVSPAAGATVLRRALDSGTLNPAQARRVERALRSLPTP